MTAEAFILYISVGKRGEDGERKNRRDKDNFRPLGILNQKNL